ncbi:MAG: signal peptidase II [Bdellovibrionota bacterium]
MQNLHSIKLWSRGFFLFLILVFIDHLSKRWAISLPQNISLGFIHLGLASLGPAFNGLDQSALILRVIHYTTFLGPLLLLYLFFSFQFLAVEKSRKLSLFLAIWMAGIVGSILDRVIFGPTIDFIALNLGVELFFNLSTVMIVVGAIGFFMEIIRNKEEYLFSNKRKLRVLQAGLQYDYIGKIIFVCVFLCVTIAIFSFTFMKFYVAEYGVNLQAQVLKLYLTQIVIISGLYLLIIMLMAFHFSNRFVGPLHGFEKYIERLESGDMDATFRVRENDHHKNLEAVADKIKAHWKQ